MASARPGQDVVQRGLRGWREAALIHEIRREKRGTTAGRHRALASRAPLYDKSEPPTETRVPSLIRILLLALILAGIVYGGMIALVTFVEPQPREMIQSIPPARLNK